MLIEMNYPIHIAKIFQPQNFVLMPDVFCSMQMSSILGAIIDKYDNNSAGILISIALIYSEYSITDEFLGKFFTLIDKIHTFK